MRHFSSNSPLLQALWIIIGMLVSVPLAFGQGEAESPKKAEIDYTAAISKADEDLKAILAELAAQRNQIATERPALSKETNEVATELREKRRLEEIARQDRDALDHELATLSNSVSIWRNERNYIESLLADFRKQYEASTTLAEADHIRELLLAADKEGDEGLAAMLDLAESAASRLPELTRPRVIPGEALDGAGMAKAGKFVEAGPVSWFIAEDGSTGGLVTESTNLQLEVVPGVGDSASIKNLSEGNSGSLEFDPTIGTAIALEESEGSIMDHIAKGGFWIYPILLMALIAAVAAIAKWLQLMRIRGIGTPTIRSVVKAVNHDDVEAAEAELANVKHPAANVLMRGVDMREQPHDDIEEALYEEYLEVQPELQRGLPLIAIAAATAPLLGLLGTVTGMIHTFKLINIFGTGDAKSLSSGISEALVTTEFGLVVAIPALILHALLSRKVQGIKAATEMASLAFINGLKKGTAEK